MNAAAALVDLNTSQLDPLWTRYKAGSAFLPGGEIGLVYQDAWKAGTLYYKLAPQWFAKAQDVLQLDDGGQIYETLRLEMDEVAARRSELQEFRVGPPLPMDEAMLAFQMEFVRRLEAGLEFATETLPKIVFPITMIVLAALAIFALGRR